MRNMLPSAFIASFAALASSFTALLCSVGAPVRLLGVLASTSSGNGSHPVGE